MTTQRLRPMLSRTTLPLLVTLVALPPAAAQFPPPPQTHPATTRPAAPPPPGQRVREFRPGVWIDWGEKAVILDGRIVLRSKPLEFLACFPGKEHESIILLDAAAGDVFMALGLVGLQPGRPPQWDEAAGRFTPARGDLIDISLEWQQDGRPRNAAPSEWIEEIGFGRPALPQVWVFAGSVRRPDGTLASDITGAGIALVDLPDNLLSLPRSRSSRNDELWAAARTEAIPPLGTHVRLRLRAARPVEYSIHLDALGHAYIDGALVDAQEIVNRIELARTLTPGYVQTIRLEGTLRTDERRWRDVLQKAGLGDDAVRFRRPATAGR